MAIFIGKKISKKKKYYDNWIMFWLTGTREMWILELDWLAGSAGVAARWAVGHQAAVIAWGAPMSCRRSQA